MISSKNFDPKLKREEKGRNFLRNLLILEICHGKQRKQNRTKKSKYRHCSDHMHQEIKIKKTIRKICVLSVINNNSNFFKWFSFHFLTLLKKIGIVELIFSFSELFNYFFRNCCTAAKDHSHGKKLIEKNLYLRPQGISNC